ncbi:hypothetical protein LUZ60_007948 [Juncus effusus]|nr:hypothetical protein LUZ60_007948 [Juncus effusus]
MQAMEKGLSSKLRGVSKTTGRTAMKKKGPRAKWNDQEKKKFTEILLSDHENTYGGLKRHDCEKIEEKMKAIFPKLNRSTEKFQQLYRDLRKNYTSMKYPGLTFNREKCILEGSDEIWEQALQEKPELRKWQGKKIQDYYVDLDILYGSDSQPPKMKTADDSSSSDEISSPEHPGISTSTPSTFIDCNEQFQNCNSENPGVQKPIDYKPRSVPEIPECIDEYYKLDGFETEDVHHVTEIFKDSDNRRIFISYSKDLRAEWLRQAIQERKEQAGPSN